MKATASEARGEWLNKPPFISEQLLWGAFPNTRAQVLMESRGFAPRAIIFHPADMVNNSSYGHCLLSWEQKTNC